MLMLVNSEIYKLFFLIMRINKATNQEEKVLAIVSKYPKMGLSYLRFYLCGMRSLHSEPYKNFLKRLYKARENAGLTQMDVAKQLGKPQSFVSKCELGERMVDVLDLLQFSKIYNVSFDFFFEGI